MFLRRHCDVFVSAGLVYVRHSSFNCLFPWKFQRSNCTSIYTLYRPFALRKLATHFLDNPPPSLKSYQTPFAFGTKIQVGEARIISPCKSFEVIFTFFTSENSITFLQLLRGQLTVHRNPCYPMRIKLIISFFCNNDELNIGKVWHAPPVHCQGKKINSLRINLQQHRLCDLFQVVTNYDWE